MVALQGLFGKPGPAEWSKDLLGISSIHATVTGVLAGFSIAVVVLLATLEETQQSTNEQKLLKQATIGVYLVAFIGYVATAILYTVVVQRPGQQQFFLYSAASSLYYFSSVLAFLGLYPLFEIVSLHLLKAVAIISLIGAVLGGFLAATIPYHDLLCIRTRWLGVGLMVSGVLSAITLILSRGKRRDLLHGLAPMLYASCGLVIVVFTMSMLMFFAPRADLWQGYLPLVGLVVLTASTAFSLFVPAYVLLASRKLVP